MIGRSCKHDNIYDDESENIFQMIWTNRYSFSVAKATLEIVLSVCLLVC